jgi:hypothetical protein
MPFRNLLRVDLTEARKAQDAEIVSLIRTLIAAIDNAEAVDSVEGGAATEVPRRRKSDDDIMEIILNERDELRHAAEDFETGGQKAEAQRLRSLSEVADRYAQAFDEGRT